MLIEEGSIRGVPVVALVGDLDRATFSSIDSSLLAPGSLRSARISRLVIDLSRLTFADSSIVVLMYQIIQELADDAWLGLVGASSGVLRVLRLAGLLAQPNIRLFQDVAEAEEALGSG